jgi:hypothetical protein
MGCGNGADGSGAEFLAHSDGGLRQGPSAIIPPTFSFIWRIPIGKTKVSVE